MAQPRLVERAKLFFFRNFERIFVLLLVFAIVAIHALVEQKFAFLSFYYLPLILAGFYGGRRFAVLAGLFVVVLVLFYQYVPGLDLLPGFYGDSLLSRSVADSIGAVARWARGAAEIIGEYGHYYEIVGEDWDIEALPLPITVKILAVADAFETLQMATPVRAAFPKWSALEEVEKGAGKTFAKSAVRALRMVAGRPEVTGPAQELRVV